MAAAYLPWCSNQSYRNGEHHWVQWNSFSTALFGSRGGAMSGPLEKSRALALAALMVFSVIAATVTLSGTVAAAGSVSISPSDDDAGASGVTYTAEGNVQLDNQDTLQYVDVHLGPADVSAVRSGDVTVYIDGVQYTDGISEFSASNGTVEFKLSNSQSLSDGDPVRVVVADVTNPADDFSANVTLHDTGDAKFQTLADTVSIDTPSSIAYSGLSVNETTLNVDERATVSATVENTGEQTGVYNASLAVDGTIQDWHNGTIAGNTEETVSFTKSFDATGAYDVTVKDLPPTEVTVTGPVAIVSGSTNPSSTDAGTTVTNQEVFVNVANVSQDGNTDWHYVEFPNAIASGLSVNSVAANATSITSSPNLVDGYDDDGVQDTVKFATSGDGGGDIALNLTVNVDVQYPDTDATYAIDARTDDSGGDTATKRGVATVRTGSAPAISDYSVSNPSGSDVQVAFDSDEQLGAITVEITNGSGSTVATLTESEFAESGSWSYSATYTAAGDGEYTATLSEATDGDGNDGAAEQSGTVTIDTMTTAVTDASATPATVSPGSTVNNQQVTVSLSGVSRDGNTDWHYVEFPNAVASGLSVNSARANATSITSSPNLVDGFDNDGVDDTVRFATSADGGGTIPLSVTVDVSIDYPDTEATYGVDTRLVDSQTGAVSGADVTTIEAVGNEDDGDDAEWHYPDYDGTDSMPVPGVDWFDLDLDGQDVDMTVALNRSASELRVDVRGAVTGIYTESAFTVDQQNDSYVYTTNVSSGTAGTFVAELETVANVDGHGDRGSNINEALDIFTGEELANGVVASPWVGEDDSAHTFSVVVPDGAVVTNETLTGLKVAYGDAFVNASGDVSSVSDDGNVKRLKIIGPDGTVKSRMGATDAVSVDSRYGEVRLDLSDVDSSRKPTIETGDRLVVSIEPVTNPETAGQYSTNVVLEGGSGNLTAVTTGVEVGSQPSVTAAATEYVGPRKERATLNLSESAVVDSLVVSSGLNTTGSVTVLVPADRPAPFAQAPGTVLTALDMTRPDAAEDSPVSIELTATAGAIQADASDLTLVRYDEATNEWVELNTSVLNRSDGTVTIAANASHTSLFAVSAIDGSSEVTGTDAPKDTTAATPATSDSSGPGFTVGLAVAGLLAAALLAVRRRD
jgi:PGF-CTERM protein/surface glycoprotein (TIGR04207 family)